jgi:hypothetical protein
VPAASLTDFGLAHPFEPFFHFWTISFDFWHFFLAFRLFNLFWAISINFCTTFQANFGPFS